MIVTEPPLRVNFIAFEMRLVNTWRSFTLSPTMAGHVGLDRFHERQSRALRHEAERGRGRAQELGEVDLARIERALAALDLGNVEDVVDDGQQVAGGVVDEVGVFGDLGRASSLRSPCSASSLENPMMALSGVRSSWLMLAMNSDFTLLASSASMRAECSATRARWRSSASPKSDAYSFISELVFWLPKAPLNITLIICH